MNPVDRPFPVDQPRVSFDSRLFLDHVEGRLVDGGIQRERTVPDAVRAVAVPGFQIRLVLERIVDREGVVEAAGDQPERNAGFHLRLGLDGDRAHRGVPARQVVEKILRLPQGDDVAERIPVEIAHAREKRLHWPR